MNNNKSGVAVSGELTYLIQRNTGTRLSMVVKKCACMEKGTPRKERTHE
jgi:hypothetical protein